MKVINDYEFRKDGKGLYKCGLSVPLEIIPPIRTQPLSEYKGALSDLDERIKTGAVQLVRKSGKTVIEFYD